MDSDDGEISPKKDSPPSEGGPPKKATPNEKWEKLEVMDSRSHWSLEGDVKGSLASMMASQQRLESTAKEVSDTIDKHSASVTFVAAEVANLSGLLNVLSDTQFIENRVFEEDISSTIAPKQTAGPSKPDSKEKIAKAIERSLKTVDEKFRVISIENSDSEEEENTPMSSVLKPVQTINRPLPHLINSPQFHLDDSLGLQEALSDEENSEDRTNDNESSTDEELAETERNKDLPMSFKRPFSDSTKMFESRLGTAGHTDMWVKEAAASASEETSPFLIRPSLQRQPIEEDQPAEQLAADEDVEGDLKEDLFPEDEPLFDNYDDIDADHHQHFQAKPQTTATGVTGLEDDFVAKCTITDIKKETKESFENKDDLFEEDWLTPSQSTSRPTIPVDVLWSRPPTNITSSNLFADIDNEDLTSTDLFHEETPRSNDPSVLPGTGLFSDNENLTEESKKIATLFENLDDDDTDLFSNKLVIPEKSQQKRGIVLFESDSDEDDLFKSVPKQEKFKESPRPSQESLNEAFNRLSLAESLPRNLASESSDITSTRSPQNLGFQGVVPEPRGRASAELPPVSEPLVPESSREDPPSKTAKPPRGLSFGEALASLPRQGPARNLSESESSSSESPSPTRPGKLKQSQMIKINVNALLPGANNTGRQARSREAEVLSAQTSSVSINGNSTASSGSGGNARESSSQQSTAVQIGSQQSMISASSTSGISVHQNGSSSSGISSGYGSGISGTTTETLNRLSSETYTISRDSNGSSTSSSGVSSATTDSSSHQSSRTYVITRESSDRLPETPRDTSSETPRKALSTTTTSSLSDLLSDSPVESPRDFIPRQKPESTRSVQQSESDSDFPLPQTGTLTNLTKERAKIKKLRKPPTRKGRLEKQKELIRSRSSSPLETHDEDLEERSPSPQSSVEVQTPNIEIASTSSSGNQPALKSTQANILFHDTPDELFNESSRKSTDLFYSQPDTQPITTQSETSGLPGNFVSSPFFDAQPPPLDFDEPSNVKSDLFEDLFYSEKASDEDDDLFTPAVPYRMQDEPPPLKCEEGSSSHVIDDLFSEEKEVTTEVKIPPVKSIFDDDEVKEDNDQIKAKHEFDEVSQVPSVEKPLFDKNKKSSIFTRKGPHSSTSLFGEEDDNELFSNSPGTSSSSSQSQPTSSSGTSKTRPKSGGSSKPTKLKTEEVEEDPLSFLD